MSYAVAMSNNNNNKSLSQPLRVAAVSYLNTKPFLAGLEQVFQEDELAIELLPPAACTTAFAEGRADLALIPVGSLLDFEQVALLDDWCIGANGVVDSVFLFAQQPVEQLSKVYLDPHSRSSNGLTRVLLQHHFGVPTEFAPAPDDYFRLIDGPTGGVIIGDRAVAVQANYAHRYDLATEWQRFCGLPFVFAVWAYRPENVSDSALARVAQGFAKGMANLPAVAAQWAAHFGRTAEQALHYYQHSIDYKLDTLKQQALRHYLGLLAEMDGCAVPQLQSATRV